MEIHDSVAELVGSTPLLRLSRFAEARGEANSIVAKVEGLNPAGSVKDRAALAMIEAAEESGELKPSSLIIEPTSGNTGIGLAAHGAAKGYRVLLVMPESMSVERRRLMAAYGAELILTPASEGMRGAVERAEALLKGHPGAWMPSQFSNPANPLVHERTTAQEIWRDTDGEVDIFVAGVGTGGTVSGVGRALKKLKPSVKVVAVEPVGSPLLSEGHAGPHKIQGVGPNFVPDNLDRSVIDEIVTVSEDDAVAAARLMARREGLLVGISSGAAAHAASLVANRLENAGKLVVTLLPDTGERYLSTGIFD